jgi:hypothetical protein
MAILIYLSDKTYFRDINYDSVDDFLKHIGLGPVRWHELDDGSIINISQITRIEDYIQ